MKLGATGEFPEGKLAEGDEGSLNLAIGSKEGKVVIDFGSPTVWIGMAPQEAATFASLIIKFARQVARENNLTIKVEL